MESILRAVEGVDDAAYDRLAIPLQNGDQVVSSRAAM